MNILNIAAYKFITLDELPTLKTALKSQCQAEQLRGTILISPEGINLMLAGLPENIKNFQNYLGKDQRFSDLYYKESYSMEYTFNRMLVKIKKEIISLGMPDIDPRIMQAPYISPKDLKECLDKEEDIYLLDTRNDYEYEQGTFKNAKYLNMKHFRDFPKSVQQLDPEIKEKKVVTFCTGGIRCEKAALVLQKFGFKNVYQLEGGILDYFAACGGAHYEGECFVFDRRVGLNSALEETNTKQCFACLSPLSQEEQQDPRYIPDKGCPHCA